MKITTMKTIGTVVIAYVMFMASSTQVLAGDVRDTGVDQCANYYYGIGEKIDYQAAYKCFQERDVWVFEILMQLNGEGTPADLKIAQETMSAWLQGDPYNSHGIDVQNMQAIIAKRVKDTTAKYPRIDYCQDVAGTTYSMGFCSDIGNSLAQQESYDNLRKIRASLTPEQAALWDNIQETFDKYKNEEGDRILQQYEDGTARSIAYDSQMQYVRANFVQLMESVFHSHSLGLAAKNDLKDLNNQIKDANQRDIDDYSQGESYRYPKGEGSDTERQEYKEKVDTYKQHVNASQKQWELLRDECSSLTASVYAKERGDWKTSMAVTMTRIRLLEIKNAPLGGG